MSNIKDTTWGGELTLHSVTVLDNVNVAIINGSAGTDTFKYLSTANSSFSYRRASWCREVVLLLDQCMAGVTRARLLCVLIHMDNNHFDSVFSLKRMLSSEEFEQLLQSSTHTKPAEYHDTPLYFRCAADLLAPEMAL
eukprot:5287932-Pleurochrysis_carterae.AAC.1